MRSEFKPDWITEELAVGPAPMAKEDYELLKNMGISFILSLQEDRELKRSGRKADVEFSIAGGFGITIYRVPAREFNEQSLLGAMDQAVDTLIELTGVGKVYLHCAQGIQRSPTVAAAYLLKTAGGTPDTAVDRVTAVHTSMPLLDVLKKWWKKRGQHGK